MNYIKTYRSFVDSKKSISPKAIERGKFYFLKEYQYVNKSQEVESDGIPPIIFTLFVSVPKNVVHAIKISDINPITAKKFFSKLFNEQTGDIEVEGSSRKLYSQIVKKVPIISRDSYRTYRLSNIIKLFVLDMEEEKLLPKSQLKIRERELAEQAKNKNKK